MVFGPVRPKKKFIGPVRPPKKFIGPVRPPSRGGGRRAAGPTRATLEAEQKRKSSAAAAKTAAAKTAAARAVAEKASADKKAASKVTAQKVAAAKTSKQRAVAISIGRAKQSRISSIAKQSKRKIMVGEVQPISRPTGFISRSIKKLEDLQKVRSTKSIRTKQKVIKNELALLGLTVGTTVVKGTVALVTLPKTLRDVAKNPSQLKKVPGAIKRGAEEFGQLIKISPTEAFGKIAGEIVFLKGSGSTFKVVGEVGGKAATKLNPKFRGIENKQITIPSGQAGKKTISIRVGGPVKKIAEPLRKQARLAGKKVTAVSAQADRLVNLIKTKRIVRKPIPGEENLKPSVKRLLNKFDKGRITKNELIRLERSVPLLERSFFADPKGRFRPSRLGTKQKDASLLDLLSGDVTFRSNKPQILVFEDVRVSKFPKNLNDVEKALKGGKTLSKSQAKRLLAFQTKKTGKFKPVGALTKEPEITLAPGEIIKRVKKVGVTLVNGRKVEIVQAKVVKVKPSTKKLMQKAKKGKITSKELKTLRKKIKKESGFNPLIGRRKGPKLRARLPKRVPGRLPKRPKRTKKRAAKAPPRKPRVPKRTKKRAAKAPPRKARVPKRPSKAPPRIPRVPKRPPVAPAVPPRLKKKKTRKVAKKKKPKQSYNVLARPVKRRKGQKRPKLIKINKVPLTRSAAKDLRNHIVDTSLARTSRIKKAKGKPQKSKLKVPKGFAKRTSKKFRTHRIVKGKRVPLPKGKVIEKRGNLLDTRQEKRKIGIRKRIKQITRKPVKRKVTRTKSKARPTPKPKQRKVFKSKRTRASMTKRKRKR